MNHLDEELAQAATPDEAPPAVPVVRTISAAGDASGVSSKQPPKRNLGLLLGLVAIAGVVVALVMNFQDAAVYARSVDKLMADKTKLAGRSVRVEGDLVKGSLVHEDSPCEYRFKLSSNGAEVPVRYANCVVPDTFRDVPGMDLKVTVEGKLADSGQFEASLVMAKCPSKYEMKQRSTNGEAAPHAATN